MDTIEPTTDSPKLMNRWLVVLGAILIQLCLGAIYAWSVFTPGLEASRPTEIASVYGTEQLSIDVAKYNEMKTEMTADSAALKTVKIEIKAEKGKKDNDARKKELDEKQEALLKKLDTIVEKYVAPDTLTSLTYGFDKTDSQTIFAAGLAAFAVVMVIAGRMMPKLGPRKLAMAGGIVLGIGYILAGQFGGTDFWKLFFFIGIIGGAGIGLAYVVPIAVGMKWFPDKKGLITGLAVAGFGFGALLWVKLAGAWGTMIATSGLPYTWTIFGIVFLVACVIGSIWMVNPPKGYSPKGWTPPANTGGAPTDEKWGLTSSQMLKTPQFYIIFFCFVFGAGAGLMSIGLMKAFPISALFDNGVELAKASAIAGTAMAVFFSLANGIGRIAWGALSDKLGRKLSIFLMLATQGIIVICFQWMAGNEYLLYLGATLIGFNFGGNFALFPTVTADTFGPKHIAQNYGWVFLAYGFGGIFGPILGGKLGDMGNFPMAFTICGSAVLLAAVLIAVMQPKKHA